jgi:hypothetical protein
MANFCIDRQIQINVNALTVTYKLRGLAYFNFEHRHYIARIVDKDDRVYFHDGMANGGHAVLETTDIASLDLHDCYSARVSTIVYSIIS